MKKSLRRIAVAALGTAAFFTAPGAEARITRIVIDSRTSPAFGGASFGAAGPYETLVGRAFGELDPKNPHDAIIQDLKLAPRDAKGMVAYTATFQITKPLDMSKASGLMWHDVPNRGGRITIVPAERNLGDIGLSSGWQGDNSGGTTIGAQNREYVIVPAAHNPNGSPITGKVLARIFNVSGPNSAPLYTYENPTPYGPASLDTRKAVLTTHSSETIDGKIGKITTIAPSDWSWGRCDAAHPFPGTPDTTQLCMKHGFDPALLYQVVFTAQDPPVLGIGFAAFRDMDVFFKHADKDDAGTPNPLAGQIKWTISRGSSQSGNFLRQFIHLGFNQDETGGQVDDGVWPVIAGRRISMNLRFAQPDGVLELDQLGSEGPQWWLPAPDPLRHLPALGILDRCTASHTCPKIIEHFGAAEVWGLHLSPDWVGTAGDKDLPLPDNVRRYYIASTQHGGGPGGFSTTPLAPPMCPGHAWGTGVFATNPMPFTQTVNAIRLYFRDWVMKGTPPPPSIYPHLADGTLVDANKQAMGFPSIPGVPAEAPTGLINPILDYNVGPGFNYADGSGVQANVPPIIKQVLPAKAPKVDADGNELGGVPVVLHEAPLGTYLGWNITAAGFFKGMECDYAGGMIPFARTKAERMAKGDPRLSLEERYTDHAGYVAAVRKAVDKVEASGFLLKADGDALIAAAEASNVLN